MDKGGKYVKLGMMMSSIKNRNSPRTMSLLGLYEGEESPEELLAIFGDLMKETKNLKKMYIFPFF